LVRASRWLRATRGAGAARRGVQRTDARRDRASSYMYRRRRTKRGGCRELIPSAQHPPGERSPRTIVRPTRYDTPPYAMSAHCGAFPGPRAYFLREDASALVSRWEARKLTAPFAHLLDCTPRPHILLAGSAASGGRRRPARIRCSSSAPAQGGVQRGAGTHAPHACRPSHHSSRSITRLRRPPTAGDSPCGE
jgi:hypothetical protein